MQVAAASKVEITAHGQIVDAKEDLFAKMDFNSDGFVSRAEFANYQEASTLMEQEAHKAAMGDVICAKGQGNNGRCFEGYRCIPGGCEAKN